ncbi:MAG: 50S ribosomal protein L21 [candidate division Zixibacteria bacterium]|jgi:large subunit ribosomal protein L21|nr:50S ribosomal protein L21 [candidate division Zixibacteria bacterium]
MYAVIETGGLQFEVEEGKSLHIPRLASTVGDKVSFDKVLLISGDEPKVGKPYVENATVEAEVVNQGKEDKIIVSTYKRRTKYRRKAGHRQPYTEIKINRIAVP